MRTQPPSQKGGGARAEPLPQFLAHVYCGQTAGWIKIALGMEVGPGAVHIVVDGTQLPSPKRGQSPPPIFGRSLLLPNGWIHKDATCYGGRPQPRQLCVRWRPSPLPQKGRSPSQFSAHVYCGQTAAWIKMPLGTDVGVGLRDIVFDVDPATPEKEAHAPVTQFVARVYCGQMAGWMKTPLGTEVDLRHTVHL